MEKADALNVIKAVNDLLYQQLVEDATESNDRIITITRSKALEELEWLRGSCEGFLKSAHTSKDADAWYYTHMGEIDMLRQLKLIDSNTRYELDKAWRDAQFPRVKAMRNAHAPEGSTLEFLRTGTTDEIVEMLAKAACPSKFQALCSAYDDNCSACWRAWLYSPLVASEKEEDEKI